jgi:hypothetical protein
MSRLQRRLWGYITKLRRLNWFVSLSIDESLMREILARNTLHAKMVASRLKG